MGDSVSEPLLLLAGDLTEFSSITKQPQRSQAVTALPLGNHYSVKIPLIVWATGVRGEVGTEELRRRRGYLEKLSALSRPAPPSPPSVWPSGTHCEPRAVLGVRVGSEDSEFLSLGKKIIKADEGNVDL